MRFVFPAAIAVCALFAILTVIAMRFYPGGTFAEPGLTAYSFWHNFFSDLGRSQSYSGASMAIPRSLFTGALILVGCAFIPYFIALPPLFTKRRAAYVLSIIGTIAGIVSAISYIGIALTPWDLMLPLHKAFVYAAFIAFVIVGCCYTPAIFLNTDYPRGYFVLMLVFTLMLFGYLYLLFFGPSYRTPSGLVIQAAGQKIIVYAEIIAMGVFSLGSMKAARA